MMSILQTTNCEDLAIRRPKTAKVLILSEGMTVPNALRQALNGLNAALDFLPIAAHQLTEKGGDKYDIAVLILAQAQDLNIEPAKSLTELLTNLSLPILAFIEQPNPMVGRLEYHDKILCLSCEESADVIAGRLACLMDIQPAIQRLNGEISRLNKITQPVNSYITQLDEEMRLAAKLQRDFLPQQMPRVPGLKFAAIYRPATWVSGDIYDVMRLDEEHIGFYVADAVGHGMPAALLTMFIKRALVTKIIMGNSYQLIEPGVALAQLGADMVKQDLSNFQFATCCYAILNIKTLRLRVANAGHPLPMLIDENANSTELDVKGPLLGVFPDQTYTTCEFQLKPRQKLLLYSDGVELAFVNEGPDKPLKFRQEFGDLACYDVESMCNRLVTVINQEEGSLNPRDDVTIVGLEILDTQSA